MSRAFCLLAVLAMSSACVRHISPYEAKHRKYEPRVIEPDPGCDGATGSLWCPNAAVSRGLADWRRASKPGDQVVVRVVEAAQAQRDATTQTTRQSSNEASIGAFLGFMKALQEANPMLDPSALLTTEWKSDFQGGGATGRSESLEATVPVTILRRIPGGNFFVEGHRVVLVNDEEHHLYVSGVVRPNDIAPDNTVLSSNIADAQIEFTGRGAVSGNMERGWFSRLLDWLWPF